MVCKCYKLAPSLELQTVRRYFGLEKADAWRRCAVLSGQALKRILGYEPGLSRIHIFDFGCLCFTDLNDDEITRFLRHAAPLFPDGSPIATSAEVLTDAMIGEPKLDEGCLRDVVPVLLARSMELSCLNTDINVLLDDCEQLIDRLSHNRRWLHRRLMARLNTRLLRFQYEYIRRLGALENNDGFATLGQMDARAAVSETLELGDRLSAFDGKLTELSHMIQFYRTDRFSSTMIGCSWIEVVMLTAFPFLDVMPHGMSLDSVVETARGLVMRLING